MQGHYRACADGVVFLGLPVDRGNGVTAQLDYLRWDGGATFPALLKQDDIFFECGYCTSPARLVPWGRFESQSFSGSANADKSQKRFQVGLTWYAEAQQLQHPLGLQPCDPQSRRGQPYQPVHRPAPVLLLLSGTDPFYAFVPAVW